MEHQTQADKCTSTESDSAKQDSGFPVKTVIDWFIADLAQIPIEVPEEMYETMVAQAIAYLKVGSPITWERWSQLGEASRLAFVDAAERLKIRSVLERESK